MRIVLVLCVIFLSGCVTQQKVSWNAVGGSRADATVEMAYNYSPLTTKPIVDRPEADRIARGRCEAWGYTSAEPFGIETSRCQHYASGLLSGGCHDMWVTLQYQCLGRGDK